MSAEVPLSKDPAFTLKGAVPITAPYLEPDCVDDLAENKQRENPEGAKDRGQDEF